MLLCIFFYFMFVQFMQFDFGLDHYVSEPFNLTELVTKSAHKKKIVSHAISVSGTYTGFFSSGSRSSLNEVLPEPPTHTGPLPSGWGQKVDHRTGRPYFEK